MRNSYHFKPSYERFEKIRRIRFPGESRSDFCLKHGFASAAMSKWKAGQYLPSTDRLYAFCEILGCRLEDLYDDMKPLVRQYDLPGIGDSEISARTLSPDTAAFVAYYERLSSDEKLQVIGEVINKVNAKR